jgi:hypothetical protein
MQAPCYIHWMNHVRVGLNTSLLWLAFILTIMAFKKRGISAHSATLSLYIGLGPAAASGSLLSYIRYTWFMRRVVAHFR